MVALQEHPQKMRWKKSRHLLSVKMQVIAGFWSEFEIVVVTVDYTLVVEICNNPKVRHSRDKIVPESSFVPFVLSNKSG